MKATLATAALAAALASTACAGDPDWSFKPGQTWTWECKTEFHYVAMPLTTIVDGQVVRRGGGFNGGGGGTGAQSSGRSSDPQWEGIVLRGTVLNVNKEGTARIEFFVESVSIETRFDSNGDHAQWDSKTSPTTDLVAYKPFEAMVGFRFEATIAADGGLRELKNADWPPADPARPVAGKEREERAASATHAPTPAEAWLNLIFASSPDRASGKYRKTIRIPQEQNVEARYDGKEQVGRISCVRTKLKMNPAPRRAETTIEVRNTRVARTLESVSLDLITGGEKRGHNWFSRDHACMIKVDLYSQTSINMAGTLVTAAFKWDIALKSTGTAGPACGPELPPDGLDNPWEPFTPTEPGGSEAVAPK